MDMTFNVENFAKKGETIFANNYYESCGGKGANQAVALAKLGVETEMLGMVGFDSQGDKLIENLKKNQIKSTILKSEIASGRAIITIDKNADNSIIVMPGSNFSIKKEDILDNIKSIRENDIIVLQNEIPLEVIEYSLKLSKENKKCTVYNPAPAKEIRTEMFKYIDYLILNETEIEFIFKKNVSDTNFRNYILKEKKKKEIKNIILTLGENGVLLFDENNNIKKFDAYKVEAKDTTAAGDSFIGAFSSKILDKVNIEEAIEYAILVSAITVTRKGAGDSIPTLIDIEKFLKESSYARKN